MKKTLTIVALILAITVSLIAGTMSYYSITIDKLAEGSVVAKEFILLKEGSDTFAKDVKIAPGETVTWEFSIKNFDESRVSETAMALDIEVELEATDGKSAITPLNVQIKENTTRMGDAEGLSILRINDAAGLRIRDSISGSGTINYSDYFKLDEKGQTKTYQVIVTWPGERLGQSGEDKPAWDDIKYAGHEFGSTVSVKVTGTQSLDQSHLMEQAASNILPQP